MQVHPAGPPAAAGTMHGGCTKSPVLRPQEQLKQQNSPTNSNIKARATNLAFRVVTGLLAVSFLLSSLSGARAQDKILAPGDAVVTGFSGIAPTGEVPPPAGTPLDTFFINLEGASAQILSFGQLGGPPEGQLVQTAPKLVLKSGKIGQVFAIGLDDGLGASIPNIYLGATSAYGLHIARPDPANPGQFLRLKKGHAQAQWMAGMFGLGAEPGSVFKVDGQTGDVAVFATLPDNTGPGVGDVVFDKVSKTFYASNLDTGLIHRIDSNGTVVGSFDHGTAGRPAKGLAPVADDGKTANITNPAFDVENPATWGYTQKDRMVYGMAVDNGRLFYAVGESHQIWSIGINGNGAFAGDPRWELDATNLAGPGPITDMLFDKSGRMYLAQRGTSKGSYDYSEFATPEKSMVHRYRLEQPDDPATESRWVSDADSYAIGMPAPHQNSNGGIALEYEHDATGALRSGARDQMLWTTGEKLRTSSEDDADPAAETDVHGLQGNHVKLIRPEHEPPKQSYFIDYDGLFNDPKKAGHMGDVEIWQPVGDFAQLPPGGYFPPFGEEPPGDYIPPPNPGYDLNLRLTKRANPEKCIEQADHWRCQYHIRVRNTSAEHWFNGLIQVRDEFVAFPAGTNLSSPHHPFPWTCFNLPGPGTFGCDRFANLGPGQSVGLTIIAKVPKGLKRCRLTNTAEIAHPISGSWNNIDPADDFDIATAIIPDPKCKPDGRKTNLELRKYADPAGCKLNPVGKVVCRFQVAVENLGPGIFDGPIHVKDISPAGTDTGFAPVPPAGGFLCAPDAPGFLCKHNPAPVVLGVNDVVSFPVWVLLTPERARELECKVRNDAHIVLPVGGSNKNTNPGDDHDFAIANVPEEICKRPHTNLAIEKVANPTTCTKSGNNWKCTWLIDVINTTANKYSGIIELNEILPAEPLSAVWNAPWVCNGVGGGGGAVCKYPETEIPGFGKKVLKIEVTFSEAQVKANDCSLLNKVEISKAPGGSPMNTNPADDSSQATATVPKTVCYTPVPFQCPPGYRPNGNSCEPKTGTKIPPRIPPTIVTPDPTCRTKWKTSCQRTPVRDCRKVFGTSCKQVPKVSCKNVPSRTCRRVPKDSCTHRVTQSCIRVPKRVCKFVGGGRVTGRDVRGQRAQSSRGRRVCKTTWTTKCTPKRQRFCKRTMVNKCTVTNKRVCNRTFTRDCERTVSTRCNTAWKNSCTRKKVRVCTR